MSTSTPAPAPAPAQWDLFCRVVDNHGDLGVGWRLSADLAARGHPVRLWVDDARALAWMAPGGAAGVEVRPFDAAAAADVSPADAVIELFGCDPPPAYVARMARRPRPALWINLEYLSAEAWVERAHGLPSPQPGGLVKWFVFPGFTPRTAGLLREPGLPMPVPPAPTASDAASVFCYANPALPALARDWPGPLRLCQGAAQCDSTLRGGRLPWLTQAGYDAMLRACGLNFVRGEDSLVRAIWAGRPFVWQIYPQHDGVHRVKLDAFLDRFLEGSDPAFAAALRRLWHAWNGFAAWPGAPGAPGTAWPDAAAWQAACLRWRDRLCTQTDLTTWLLGFAARRGGGPGGGATGVSG